MHIDYATLLHCTNKNDSLKVIHHSITDIFGKTTIFKRTSSDGNIHNKLHNYTQAESD